jgi:hypothetical protein
MLTHTDETEPQGVQAFSWLALTVFNRLYDEFPTPVDFSGLRFVLDTVLTHGPESEESGWSKYFDDTLKWLEREGFITIAGRTIEGKYISVALTLRGLTALGYTQSSIRRLAKKGPLIHKVKELLGSGFKATSGVAAKVLLGKLFEAMLRAHT